LGGANKENIGKQNDPLKVQLGRLLVSHNTINEKSGDFKWQQANHPKAAENL
jgi:hypothetical protein